MNIKEQDDYEGARRGLRSKTKMKEQTKAKEQDEEKGAIRRWRNKTKMNEQDEDG